MIKPDALHSPTVDAAQQEKQILEDAKAGDMAGIDIAAKHFELYMPMFKQYLRQLSRKQLIRLMSALVEYPLEKVPYKHNEKLERDAFMIGDKLLQSKYMMIIFTLAASQEINNAANQALSSETIEANKEEGVNNGSEET